MDKTSDNLNERDLWSQFERVKKSLSLTNKDIGLLLEKEPGAVSKAVNRKSLDEYDLNFIVESIELLGIAKEEDQQLELNILHYLVKKKMKESATQIFDKIRDMGDENKLKNAILHDSGVRRAIEEKYHLGSISELGEEPDNHLYLAPNIMMVPLVGYRARAGFLEWLGATEYCEDLPKVPWEVDLEYKGKHLCFEVMGDSMDDNTPNALLERDVLLCREIKQQHWQDKLPIRQWDFVIVHSELGIVVKRISEHNIATGYLTLHSLNDVYEDYRVNLKDCLAIYNIVEVKRSRRR